MSNHNRSRTIYVTLVFALATLALASVGLRPIVGRTWLLLLLTPSLLLGFHYRHRLNHKWQGVLAGVVLAVLVAFAIDYVEIARSNIAHPREWDFQAFWLDGQVAAHGLNFYEPESYQQLAQSMTPSEDFILEILDTGFRYPPATMLLFVPLGWFDMQTASLLWHIVHSLVLVVDIVLLWRNFFRSNGLIGLALSAALMLMLRATMSTIFYAQTNFLVLLILLLFWQDRSRQRSGIWLAIGVFLKPYLLFLLLYLLLRRRWRALVTAGITIAVISILAIIVFSPETFLSYFTAASHTQMPDYVYTESVNQSLLATILRITGYDISNRSPLTQPLFVGLALILTGLTGWLVFRLDMLDAGWALGLTLLLALLVYPATLEHYSVLLIVPMLLLWTHRDEILGGLWSALILITLTYVLVAFSAGTHAFFAILLNWLALTGIMGWTLVRRASQSSALQTSTSTN